MGHARGGSAQSEGLHPNALGNTRWGPRLRWLEDGQHPLDWNGPTSRVFTRFRAEDLDRPIIDHFERVARRHRNRIAVTDPDTSLSYGELWDGLSGLAETIAAETRPGELVGILLPTCSMFPLAMLACLAAGRPFVALDPQYPGSWLGQVLEDAQPALIIGRKDVLGGIETVAPGARVIHLNRLPQAARTTWRPTELGLDQPACVVFTSGSTGRPKGIVNSQRNLLQRVAQSINAAHINPEDRFLTLASLCTIVGVRDTMTALLAGASVHLLDPQRAGAREIVNVVRAEAITILFAFPALLRSVIPHGGERAPDALRLVRIGGDTTLWSDIDLLRGWLEPEAAIQLIYAATEAPMMQWFVDASCRTDDPRIPIGCPLPGNRLAVIDEHGRNAPPGEVGELVVGSPYVAVGQWVDGRCVAGASKAAARPPVDCSGREISCANGPTGCWSGSAARTGRSRFGRPRRSRRRGSRPPPPPARARRRRPGEAGDQHERRGWRSDPRRLCERSREAHAGLLDDLKEMMRSAPSPMRPGRLHLVQEIPRLPSSKLDVRALMALDEVNVQNERATVAAAAEPGPADGDDIARTVAHVWQEVLQTPVGGPEDDFFDAGGDSLKAITFVLDLERALGLELSLTLITEAPTFARLCEALREHRTTRYVPLVLLKPGDGLPPVFFIHGVGGNVVGLLPMTRRMTYQGAVIGIQARGLDGREPPHATVEAMAAEYLREVKARQPDGPYYLCGYSFGGLVAFEMARRLREVGRRSRPGRPVRHHDEPGEMAGAFVALHCPPSTGAVRRRRDRRSCPYLAVGSLEHGPPCLRKTARLSDVRAHQGFQGGGQLADRLGAVSARLLSRGTDAVHSGRARTRPPVTMRIWRTHARALSIVNRRRPFDDVLRDQRRVHRRILDALSSRAPREPFLLWLTRRIDLRGIRSAPARPAARRRRCLRIAIGLRRRTATSSASSCR